MSGFKNFAAVVLAGAVIITALLSHLVGGGGVAATCGV